MLKKLTAILILFSFALVLTSCFEPSAPKVEYKNYEVGKISAEGIELNFYFDVENSNPLPIDVTNYTYKVYINNMELLSENRSGFSLPASGKKKITIPVMLRYVQVFGSIFAVIERVAKGEDTVPYRIEGSLTAGTLGITASSPIKASGVIPIPKNIKL